MSRYFLLRLRVRFALRRSNSEASSSLARACLQRTCLPFGTRHQWLAPVKVGHQRHDPDLVCSGGAAGAVGGVANFLIAPLFGALHLTTALGVSIAPPLLKVEDVEVTAALKQRYVCPSSRLH